MAKPNIVATYRDIDIAFNSSSCTFEPIGSELFDGARFDSLQQAKNDIDARLKLKTTQARDKLKLEGIDVTGKDIVCTGIHMTQGVCTGVDSDWYPRVDWVREDLAERAALLDKLKVVNDRLGRVEIDQRRGYGRMSPDNYVTQIEKLKAEHAKAIETAGKGRPPPRLPR